MLEISNDYELSILKETADQLPREYEDACIQEVVDDLFFGMEDEAPEDEA